MDTGGGYEGVNYKIWWANKREVMLANCDDCLEEFWENKLLFSLSVGRGTVRSCKVVLPRDLCCSPDIPSCPWLTSPNSLLCCQNKLLIVEQDEHADKGVWDPWSVCLCLLLLCLSSLELFSSGVLVTNSTRSCELGHWGRVQTYLLFLFILAQHNMCQRSRRSRI